MSGWTALRRYEKNQREMIDRMSREFSSVINDFKVEAERENDARDQQLIAAQERIAQLEALVRKLYDLAYERESDHDYGHQTRSECRYCGAVSNLDERVEHDAGCFVADAKRLLDQNFDNSLNKTDAPA
jgi:hypothetical protein